MDDDYHQRFSGIGRLYGTDALPRLRAAHVCIIGVGGVGSWIVEALARSGIGALTLIDADDVCVTNINRQLPALTDTVGRPKVDVLAERARLIWPGCAVTARGEFFTESNAVEMLSGPFDFVVDGSSGDAFSCAALRAGDATRWRYARSISALRGRTNCCGRCAGNCGGNTAGRMVPASTLRRWG